MHSIENDLFRSPAHLGSLIDLVAEVFGQQSCTGLSSRGQVLLARHPKKF